MLADIPPVFIKDQDLGQLMSEFKLCSTIAKVIDPDSLIGCQKIGKLWRIYIGSTNARDALLTHKLKVNNIIVPVYKDNPNRTGAQSPEDKSIRIVVKDLPLSVHSGCLENFLQKAGVTMAKKIEFGKARDPDTHQLSNWYNGDRIIYAKDMQKDIPRYVQVGTFTCRVFYDGQEQKTPFCTRCFQEGHTTGKCTNPKACKACKKSGHAAGAKGCEGYLKQSTRLSTIKEDTEPLSASYSCDLNVLNMSFNSIQQAYQYSKAIKRGQPELAAQILSAPTPNIAKNLAKFLKVDANWTQQEKTTLMKQLLEAKLDQVPEAAEALQATGRNCIVLIDSYDYDWGSGMTEEETLHTKKRFWAGKNIMGTLLEEFRSKLFE